MDRVEFNIRMVEYIAVNCLPLNHFSKKGVQNFYKYLTPNVTYPKRTALTKRVSEVFLKTRKIVKKLLQDNKSKISFTVNGWALIKGKSCYGVIRTLHILLITTRNYTY